VHVPTNHGRAGSCSQPGTGSPSASPSSRWLPPGHGSSRPAPLFSLKFRKGKMTGRSCGRAGCSPCGRRLWSSARCWLAPRSLPASRNSSAELVRAPRHAGEQPGRLAKGLGARWRGHGSRGSVSPRGGGPFAMGSARHVRLRRGWCRSWGVVHQ